MLDANTTLLDELIRHQIYVERFKQGQLTAVAALLGRLMDDVAAQLGRQAVDLPPTVRSRRLTSLLQDLRQLSQATGDELAGVAQKQLQDLAAYEGGYVASAVRAVLPVTVSFETVGPDQLWAAVVDRPFEGRVLKQWFRDYTASQTQKIQGVVQMGVVEGQTVDQMVRRLRGTAKLGFKDGVLQGASRRQAEALVRTGVNHTVTTARDRTIADNQQVVKAVLWRSTLDGKTSEICMARDGRTYPVGFGPRPPAHPSCRSTVVPVLKSWKELGINLPEADEGTRASMNGQVPASETYQTWLARQPASFQDDVLGKTKGKLFRQGGLTLDKFVDEQAGRGYTLDELRAKHPTAFAQARV